MRYPWMVWLAVPVLLLAAACAEESRTDGGTTEDPTPQEALTDEDEDAADPEAATVSTEQRPVGEVLVDGDGMSLYLFENDEQGESTCYDDCEMTWPPLVTTAEPTAAGSAEQDLLGTITREDGSTQVTYNDWPLYYFANDSAAGDAAGQGIGGVWWLVDPAGEAVQDQPE